MKPIFLTLIIFLMVFRGDASTSHIREGVGALDLDLSNSFIEKNTIQVQ